VADSRREREPEDAPIGDRRDAGRIGRRRGLYTREIAWGCADGAIIAFQDGDGAIGSAADSIDLTVTKEIFNPNPIRCV